MTKTLTIALAQLNPVVGDVAGNAERLLGFRHEAAQSDADLVVYSELVLIGYPPEDLVLKPALIDHVQAAIDDLAKKTGDGGPAMLIGAPLAEDGALYNAAFLLDGGRVAGVRNVASSGFGVDKCKVMGSVKAPIDIVGTGSYLPENWPETYATADIVAYDGKPAVKLGREFLLKK